MLINSVTLLDGYVLEFNKIKNKYIKDNNINIKILLNFILEQLHDELNQNKIGDEQGNIDDINDPEELKSYKNFLNYYKKNKSPIQDLFYGEKEVISRCSLCKKTRYSFDINKLLYFDIKSYTTSVDIKEIIKDYEKQEECLSLCTICKQNAKLLSRSFLKKLPEILILCFDNVASTVFFKYYLNLMIRDEPYVLICFIIKADEENKKDDKYNVFYLEKEKWFIYNITKKEVKEIKEITNITKNPLVTFYQKRITHDRILLNKYYNILFCIFKNLQEIPKKLKENIKDKIEFEKYYILNKNLFNKMTKIFESEEKYKNNNLIFESFNQVTNIPNLNVNELKEKAKLFKDRLKALRNENLFEIEFEINEKNSINYPKDFILIKENEFDELLITNKVDINYIKNNLCDVLFGENYLFIKSNKYENQNVYYICNSFLFLFNVEKIFKFNDKKYFIREIGYIKNKGIDYYLQLRNLNINTNEQKIIDRENEYIGDFINIISNNTMIEFYKCIQKENENNKNSMAYNCNLVNKTNFNDDRK